MVNSSKPILVNDSLPFDSTGALTVLHVFDPQDDTALLRGRARRQGLSLLAEARRLGERNDVPIKTTYVMHTSPEAAIQRAALARRYDLVVVGTSLREGAGLAGHPVRDCESGAFATPVSKIQDPTEKIYMATIPLGSCISALGNTMTAPARRVMASHQPLIALVAA